MNRLFECNLNAFNITPNQAIVEDLRHLVKEGEVDDLVRDEFDLLSCGELNEPLKIKGSKSLLKGFEKIDCKKIDITEILKNMEFIGFDEDNIVLDFMPTKENGDKFKLRATGIYSFTKEFLEYHFRLKDFAEYCFEYQHQDILISNLTQLLDREKKNRRQYRLIEKEGEYFIRGMTSDRYKNYDNNLAIYIALYSLHQFAKEQTVNFQVEQAILTDSDIYLFIEQENSIYIKGFGKLYFGIFISNNELAKGAFSIEFRYRIINDNNRYFGGILENKVMSINHTINFDNVISRLPRLKMFKEVRKGLLKQIHTIKKMPYLSEDHLYKMFSKIINSRKAFSKETKESARQLKETIENTYTIIELLNRVDEITSDVEEKLHLERIFNDVLSWHYNSVSKNK